jgi:hypothetical protein
MAKIDATIEANGDARTLRIGSDDKAIHIPLSEDAPNKVKAAFNRLLIRLRDGDLEIAFDDTTDDLFAQVAAEYIQQLNSEIREIRRQMKRHGLTSDDE